MKPTEKKPYEVFRIIDKQTGDPVGSYSRAYCDEYDFASVDDARTANCHGKFESKEKYQIAKYRVTYELIDPDCDNAKDFPKPIIPPDGVNIKYLADGNYLLPGGKECYVKDGKMYEGRTMHHITTDAALEAEIFFGPKQL